MLGIAGARREVERRWLCTIRTTSDRTRKRKLPTRRRATFTTTRSTTSTPTGRRCVCSSVYVCLSLQRSFEPQKSTEIQFRNGRQHQIAGYFTGDLAKFIRISHWLSCDVLWLERDPRHCLPLYVRYRFQILLDRGAAVEHAGMSSDEEVCCFCAHDTLGVASFSLCSKAKKRASGTTQMYASSVCVRICAIDAQRTATGVTWRRNSVAEFLRGTQQA